MTDCHRLRSSHPEAGLTPVNTAAAFDAVVRIVDTTSMRLMASTSA
jgi:hypothetical protein